MIGFSGPSVRCRTSALAAAAMLLTSGVLLLGALSAPVGAAPADEKPAPKADSKADSKADEKSAPTGEPKADSKAETKSDEKPAPKADAKAEEKPAAKPEPVPAPPEPKVEPDEGPNLKNLLLGGGRHRVEVPRLPVMSLRGFIHVQGRAPAALLEIKEINRTFVVREGSEIPIMVAGRLAPPRDVRTEVIPKAGTPAAAAKPADPRDQTQVILKVKSISAEGVVVEAGVLSQTLIIR